jgi:hypothetical protein
MHSNIEKQILHETEGLPENALDEVLHFIQFIKSKLTNKKATLSSDSLSVGLAELENQEWKHLESEMKDYKKIFPYAK